MMETVTFDRFRHSTPIQVRWTDLDQQAHVDSAAYLTYMEHARRQYIQDLRLSGRDTRPLDFLLAQVTIDYRLPLIARDRVTIYTRTCRVTNKSLELEQLITRHLQEEMEVAAVARLSLVVVDPKRAQSTQVPDAWRNRISDFEPGL